MLGDRHRLPAVRMVATLALTHLLATPASVYPFSVRPWESRIYAVVVGANENQHERQFALEKALPDAEAFHSAITNVTHGLAQSSDVVLLTGKEATRVAIMSSLKGFLTAMDDEDTLLLYWSGHSAYRESELYLLPYDATHTQNGDYTNSIGLTDLLSIEFTDQQRFVFIGDSCNIGDGLARKLGMEERQIGVLSASKEDELAYDYPDFRYGLFTNFLLASLESPNSDIDGDGYISLEEAYHSLYSPVVRTANGRQHPTVAGRSIHKMELVRAPRQYVVLNFENDVPIEFLGTEEMQINGVNVTPRRTDPEENSVTIVGDFEGLLHPGLNEIVATLKEGKERTRAYLQEQKRRFLFWQENKKLKVFENPYKESHAIIVAIDDYDRAGKMGARPTGYRQLDFMVDHAIQLTYALQQLGFPPDNITTLYNSQATSKAIDDALRLFWKGGEHESADRVFFYFGGHGASIGTTGYLVTYDHDRSKPTLTGFLMKDLTGRHSENIAARHVLFALDSCEAGLAVYQALEDDIVRLDQLREFRFLSLIRNDMASPARNILLAGTGDQNALWTNGGVFTKALVRALSGEADHNEDGLLQFKEIAMVVKNEVAYEAARSGVVQNVGDYKLSHYGSGEIMFLLNRLNHVTTDGKR